MNNPGSQLHRAVADDDAESVRRLLEVHPSLARSIDEPTGPFDTPAIVNVRSKAMLDALLDAGANPNARSRWWAGGFGLLDLAPPELAAYAIERGVTVDVHAAARLGLMERLRELVDADPALVHARGGDGQTPLHFAANVEVPEYLLDRGAEIDARDVDHESTPAQYMLDRRHDIARHLVARGARADLLMAAALGDIELARRLLDADPACIRLRVDDASFPKADPRSGGTIYQWTLGWHASPFEVARKFGHANLLPLLQERSPAEVRLLDACWSGDEAAARDILRDDPGVVGRLDERDRRMVAHAARNALPAAVRLMLECGWPVDARGQHGATPLHWAAFHGDEAMARTILRFAPPLDARDADYRGTPLDWALHGSENGWRRDTGDYPATVAALLDAGSPLTEHIRGTEAVRQVLQRYGTKRD